MIAPKKPLTILLASPRGFCAGVDRAIQIVERALERYGRPVYVRHEIVHNRFVVENLEAQGAIFVDELDEVPDDRPVVFSAHGVPKSVPAEAARRNLLYVDATCPLVSKVHREAERHAQSGRTVVLIGHAGHPEVIGTMGQLPPGKVVLVEDAAQAETLVVADPENLAYATQTTLSVDDTTGIVSVLRRRFPSIQGPKMEDICYATTNRQAAVKAIAQRCDAMVVIGAVSMIVLLLLGVKAPFALAFIAGLCEFIPTVGPVLSAVPAVLMAFVDSPEKALAVLIAYWGIQFLENNLLIPYLMRGEMDLPPAITLVAQSLMTLVFGFIGLMVAVPLTAAVLVPLRMMAERENAKEKAMQRAMPRRGLVQEMARADVGPAPVMHVADSSPRPRST
jgi:4-hydroxy-3-methylbut-2-enyl diphosphate reductase